MTNVPWQEGGQHRGQFSRFLRRPVQKADPANRFDLEIRAPIAHAMHSVAANPEPVRRLLVVAMNPAASGVQLDVSTDNAQTRTGDPVRLRDVDAVHELPGVAANGPSLAARLRVLLALPFALLLPGRSSRLTWHADLLPFQMDGLRLLLTRERVLLADDMGLGKTVQALAAIRILAIRGTITRTLLIVPASLLGQWRREVARWAPELRAIVIRGAAADRAWQWRAEVHVLIVGYETFRSDYTDNPESGPRRRIWDLVVLDEAQKIKNRDVEVSRDAKRLRRRRSWALTGTPLENRVEDLASIIEFVDQGAEISEKRWHPGRELIARHRELQLRRRKQDVLTELPPKRVTNLTLSLPPRQREVYDRAEREGIFQLRERGKSVRIQHVLELITRLKQLCNFDPVSHESGKVSDIRDRLGVLTAEGHRALIFSQYVNEPFGVHAIAKALSEFDPLTYTGGQSSSERDRTIAIFKTDTRHKILVLSIKAGGFGLNLQEASYVFHVDRWWNPAVERQAEDRAHRMGQLVPVNVFKYTCEETVEERIAAILASKQELFDEIVDDVSVDIAAHLSAAELFGLFGLTVPRGAGPVPKAAAGTFIGRCEAVLVTRGWRIARRAADGHGDMVLIARRVDEIGLEQIIHVFCAGDPVPVELEAIREFVRAFAAFAENRGVVAAPAGLTLSAQHEADERGIAIWDEAQLTRFEQASLSATPEHPAGGMS